MKRRRRFTPEFKAQVVLEVLRGTPSLAEACRKHALSPNLLSAWKSIVLPRAHPLIREDEQREEDQARIAELEPRLERATRQIEILKSLDVPGGGLEQKREVIDPLKDDYSIRLLSETLDVPRSNQYHQPRPTEDQPLGEALKELAGQGPTSGYRRLTVMLRRQGHTVHTKRVRRLRHELGFCGTAPVQRPRTTNVGEPEENGYAERLMRTIKEEEIDLSEYEDFADALRQLG
jgi:putative transposase